MDVEAGHLFGEPAQRPRDQRKGHQAGHQAQQRHQADGPQRRAEHRVGRALRHQLVMRLALQHHVDEAHFLAVDAQRRRAEDLAAFGAARVVTQDGQRAAFQQPVHGGQVHALAAHAAVGGGMAGNAAVGVQQVDLHAGVDQHELVEEAAHGAGHEAVGVGQLGVARNAFGHVARQALHHFQLVHAAGAQLHPGRGAAAHQQQHGKDQGKALGQCQAQFHGHAPSPASANL